MAKEADALHICVQLLQDICLLPINQHIEGFSKRKIAHDIEAVVIEPCCHVHGFAGRPFDRGN
jgi:hypothetical protein